MQMDTEVSEDERARNAVRNLFARQAVISAKVVKGKDEEAAKYRDYFDFSSPLKRRLLKPSIETEFASLSKRTGR